MSILTRIASDGMPIEMTDCTMDASHTKLSIIAPTYKRYPERAGKTITVENKTGGTICKDLKGVETGKVLCTCPDCIRAGVEVVEEVLRL